ncbi:basic salivary proline-rich protein 4-like [Ursus americanus]|uniref:basic salivary proline-rich protein 4-like n=1 Tax=Ursus americanus TaxID=9643 RepID=UPI001E67B6FA|nr:basic salivary proline-rich protein 4-like [Ursus americanus]
MAPPPRPPRPPPDRRDGPARLGSGDTEPPPPPAGAPPLGRIRTSAARRRGGPAAAGRVRHPAPATRGCTQGRARDAARGRGRGACRRDSVPGTPWALRRQRGGGRGARGPPDRCPASSGRKASGGSPTGLVLLRRLTGTKLLRPNAGQAPRKRLRGIFVMDVDCWGMHPHAWRVAHPNSTGTEAPGSGPFQTSPFVPLNLAVHLYLYNILCHKLGSGVELPEF